MRERAPDDTSSFVEDALDVLHVGHRRRADVLGIHLLLMSGCAATKTAKRERGDLASLAAGGVARGRR
jgi:hypothetical protein